MPGKAKDIIKEFGPCPACAGTGKVRGNTDPFTLVFTLGTSLRREKRCAICGGSARVVTKTIERVTES